MRHRFTPTCVGNTGERGCSAVAMSVHPHVCGEYRSHDVLSSPANGSPPRVWGIRLLRRDRRVHQRFTPTCVGNTAPGTSSHRPCAVHPHVCGEYARRLPIAPATAGSPPRVWGILVATDPYPALTRFTPTCVGNTNPQFHSCLPPSVHPHVCGEYQPRHGHSLPECGSPPRVWGILEPSGKCWVQLRFTPTCVGNTVETRARARLLPVHPHVCGEYDAASLVARDNNGSPPRVWGIPPASLPCGR